MYFTLILIADLSIKESETNSFEDETEGGGYEGQTEPSREDY